MLGPIKRSRRRSPTRAVYGLAGRRDFSRRATGVAIANARNAASDDIGEKGEQNDYSYRDAHHPKHTCSQHDRFSTTLPGAINRPKRDLVPTRPDLAERRDAVGALSKLRISLSPGTADLRLVTGSLAASTEGHKRVESFRADRSKERAPRLLSGR